MPIYRERAAGIYRSKFLGTDERDMTNPESGVEERRWIWKFQELADPTSAGQIDKITGTSMKSANSNAYKIATGLLGRKPGPGDDTDSCIGRIYDVVYGPNQAGNLTITSVVVVGAPIVNQEQAETIVAAEAAPTGDLPF